MRRRINCICLLLLVVLLLTGCMKTVDQLYRLPKRSDEFTELQIAIDEVMTDLNYCAPCSGENRQAVQMADLDGDGRNEYLVYASNDSQSLLSILVFKQSTDGCVLACQLQCNGATFDMVEYAQLDDQPGMELILGTQLAETLQRKAEVYTFSEILEVDLLMSVRYAEFLVLDLDQDDISEIFLLKPAAKETDPGVVELYRIQSGTLNCSNTVNLSAPIENLEQVISGSIHGGIPAVFAASTVNDTAIITDVFILKGGQLHNVTLSGEAETNSHTLRSHYVFAQDIDSDGIVELPYLLPMMPMDNMVSGGKQELIRWYAVKSNGDEVSKTYTFHNFMDGWYLELDDDWAQRLTVVSVPDAYAFYIWDDDFKSAQKVLTIFESVGTNRIASQHSSSEILLYDSLSLGLSAQLETDAANYGIDEAALSGSFHIIRQD